MEAVKVKSQQALIPVSIDGSFSLTQKRTWGWQVYHDLRVLRGFGHCKLLTPPPRKPILSLCAGGLENGSPLRNVDHGLEPRRDRAYRAAPRFETMSARNAPIVFHHWWRCASRCARVCSELIGDICLLILPTDDQSETAASRGVRVATSPRKDRSGPLDRCGS